MVFNIFNNGTLADATQVNNNLRAISRAALEARLLAELLAVYPFSDIEGTNSYEKRAILPTFTYTSSFIGETILDKQTYAHVDTSNTTCFYTEGGIVAFCDIFDLFDDASIDSNRWNTSVTSGGTVTETGGYILVNSPTSSDTAAAISNGTTSLNINGQDSEIIIDFRIKLTTGGSTTSSSANIQLSNGTTHVTLYGITLSLTSEATDIRGMLRIVYDHSALTCDVYLTYLNTNSVLLNNDEQLVNYGEEVLIASAVDVSTVTTNKFLRFSTSTGGNTATAELYVYGVGYRLNGASAGTTDFVNTTDITSDSISSAFFGALWLTKPSGTITTVFSTDGTTTYGSDNCWDTWGDAPSSGTNIKARIRVDKPTVIDGTTKNIPVMYSWGALLN